MQAKALAGGGEREQEASKASLRSHSAYLLRALAIDAAFVVSATPQGA